MSFSVVSSPPPALLCIGGLLVCLILPAGTAHAQDQAVRTTGPDLRITLGGIFQSRLSYGWMTNTGADEARRRLGFGIRRARLQVNVSAGPHAGLYLHVDGAPGTVGMLDAYAFYRVNDRLRLRLGRMASAQPRALILTSASRIDAIDRAAIAERWAGRTIGSDGRDFGFDVRYGSEQGEAVLFVHNGDGDWGRARGNFRESILGDVTGGVDRRLRDLAVSFYSTLTPTSLPGVEFGGFVSYNGSRNPNTAADDRGRDYVSYAGHLYWGAEPGSQPVRLKVDVLGIQYEEVSGVAPGLRDQHSAGFALLGAFRVHRAAELFARAERYDPNINEGGRGDTYLTGGASLSLSALRGGPYHRERLTLGYAARLPEDDEAPVHHLVVLQAQIAY